MTLVLFDFQKLEVYIKATALKSYLHLSIKGQYFDRSIYNQLQRASLSVILNIAEGSGRSTKNDRRNFFTIARASLFECVAIFDLLRQENHLSEEQHKLLVRNADQISRMLYTMIRNLS